VNMEKHYWEERIQAYLDNELEPADRLAVEAYLKENQKAKAELDYFKALKKRLRAFRDSVRIPRQVEQRILSRFGKQKRWIRPSWVFLASALAAAVLLAIFLPQPDPEHYSFVKSHLRGKLVCYGCEVAKRADLGMGELCANGHLLGLADQDGNLWHFARDVKGVELQRDFSLAKTDVEIDGWALPGQHMFRVEDIKSVPQASQHAPASILTVQ